MVCCGVVLFCAQCIPIFALEILGYFSLTPPGTPLGPPPDPPGTPPEAIFWGSGGHFSGFSADLRSNTDDRPVKKFKKFPLIFWHFFGFFWGFFGIFWYFLAFFGHFLGGFERPYGDALRDM